MNRGRGTPPHADPGDEALADHTVMVSRRSALPAEVPVSRPPGPLAKPARDTAPLDDPDDAFPDRTRMASRRASLPIDATHQPGPPTDGTIVVRQSGPLTDGTIVVRQSGPLTDGTVVVRRPSPPTDGTIAVARQLGPPTDGTIVVRQSGPPTDGTVVVRSGRPSGGTAMADPVLRGRPRPGGVPKPPRSVPEERPRYTPRAIPPPPGPPLQVVEGPTALRGTALLPSVAAASRRTARVALTVWLVLSAACAVGVVWCATELFGG